MRGGGDDDQTAKSGEERDRRGGRRMMEKYTLPSRYWEPQPDEEDLERMEAEWSEQHKEEDDEELPFM